MTNLSQKTGAGIAGLCVLGALLAASCARSEDINVIEIEGDNPPDATANTEIDGGTDAEQNLDSSSDAHAEGSEDAASDAGDAGLDAESDGALDATPDALAATGLALFLKFENTTGPEFDYSGNNNAGLVSGPVARGVNGKADLAFDFGATGMVVAKSSPSLDMLTGATIELWVKLSAVSAGSIVARGTGMNDHSVRIKTAQGNVQVYFTRAGGGSAILTSDPNVLVTGQWTHVAATNDGSTLKLYINGTLHASGTGGQLGSLYSDLHVGKSAGTDSAFNGAIDELRWWTVARTDTEVCEDAGGTASSVEGSTVCSLP